MSKTILITGTSSGFGKLITQTLLNNGHRVIATMRQPDGKNAAAAEEIRSYGNESNLLIAELDVTQDTSVNNAVEKAIDQFGTIDVLINNAGIGNGGISEGFTTEQFQNLMDVNVTGVHRVTRAVLPAMRKNEQGLIINISSVMGRIVIPFATAYTTSKFALEGYTESLHYELKNVGIDVVSVEPGGFGTSFFDNMIQPADEERVKSYGDFANVPEQMWEGMAQQINSEDGPDPQEVADAVLDLVEQSNGKRPLRIVVDPMSGGEGPKKINETTKKVQDDLFEAFGLK